MGMDEAAGVVSVCNPIRQRADEAAANTCPLDQSAARSPSRRSK